MKSSNLRFSIVTPSFNQGRFLEKTILSVLDQNYSNFEHIIVDGGSTDNTIDILRNYPHLFWISEPDSGQSNAINKGFKMASGDIFAWINSDDYYEKNIFAKVANYFLENPNCDFLYGDITYVDQDRKSLFNIVGGNINFNNLLRNPDLIRQPSFFWRKEKHSEIGGVDESLDLVMDYDFFLKMSKQKAPHYINMNFSYYRVYDQTKTLSNLKNQAREILKVMVRHKNILSLSMIWFVLKRYLQSFNIFRKLGKIKTKFISYVNRKKKTNSNSRS